jgi:hypothetical protein
MNINHTKIIYGALFPDSVWLSACASGGGIDPMSVATVGTIW